MSNTTMCRVQRSYNSKIIGIPIEIDSINIDIYFTANIIPVPSTYPSIFSLCQLFYTHYIGNTPMKGRNLGSSTDKNDDSDRDNESSSSSYQPYIAGPGGAADAGASRTVYHVFGSCHVVEQYDLITKKTIARFKNQSKAAAAIDGDASGIWNCVHGRKKKYKDFGWRFAKSRRLAGAGASSSRSSRKGKFYNLYIASLFLFSPPILPLLFTNLYHNLFCNPIVCTYLSLLISQSYPRPVFNIIHRQLHLYRYSCIYHSPISILPITYCLNNTT